MRKRAAPAPSTMPPGDRWDQAPRQAVRPTMLDMALVPELPVYSAGDGSWHANAQQATLPAMAVQGITVVDDLAREAVQPAVSAPDRQLDEDEQQEQQSLARRHQPAAKQQRAATGLRGLHGIASRESRRQAAKQQLALAAQQLLQDPEREVSQLKGLLEFVQDDDPQVCRLAMLTLLAVFKDLIPAYRIRPSKDEATEQLSKEVRALRAHEAALLDSYHAYLMALLRALKASNAGRAPVQQGRVAAKCMAALLAAAPHFNYRSDLLQALVTYLPHKDEYIRKCAQSGVAALLATSHGGGDAATEAVQLVADLVRQRKCILPPSALDCLLGLQFPDITSPTTAADGKSAPHRKKRRKQERDAVDRSFVEAQAAADLASRRANQTATLEALFEMLFRVLKTCSSSQLMQLEAASLSRHCFQEKFPLLFPVLRLLGKFVHLVGIEYVDDITAQLRLLLHSSALPPQERLSVLVTAVDIVKHQGGTVTAEHAGFYSELFAALKHIMLVPLLDNPRAHSSGGPRDRELSDDEWFSKAAAAAKANGDTIGGQVCYLTCQALEQLLLDSKLLDGMRQAAFLKRMLAASAAAGDTGLTVGLLCVLQRMLRRSRHLQGMLQHEEGGPSSQGYRPDVDDPAEACALTTPLWELSLLTQHYHPRVRSACAELAAGDFSSGNFSRLLPLSGSVAAFAASFSTSTGAFCPPPPPAQLK